MELIYLLKTLLLPLSSLLFLALWGVVSYPFKFNQTGRFMSLISLLGLYILAMPIVATRLAVLYQSCRVLDINMVSEFNPQAIVVLGGGIHSFAPEYSKEPTVNARTLLRLRYGAKLAKQLKLPVLVSGGNVFNTQQPTEASLMAAILQNEFNIPTRWLETKSRNTAENAFFSRQILLAEKIDRIILVTHAIHMPRAVEQFRRVGFKKIQPAPTVLTQVSELNLRHFLPSVQALELSTLVVHEWLGRIWYRVRY